MAQRLSLRHDRSDTGQLLAQTGRALALPADSVTEQAHRAAALAAALVAERLVVPVPVETHPDETGEHRPQGLGEDDQIPLPVVVGEFGSAVLAFSSAAQLAAWDRAARPMTMSSQRVAVAASQAGAPASILVDAGSPNPVVLPVGAVHALVGGDVWLEPWNDPSLTRSLLQAAQSWCPQVVDVQVSPIAAETAVARPWGGALEVTVLFAGGSPAAPGPTREQLANALAAISKHPKLLAAAPAVTLVPQPVASI